MYCTLLLLLYGTAMRIGEALRLTLQDVDLAERVITVRCTKFFKTRPVPKLADELAAHLERRGLLPMPLGKAAPLFASRGIRGWSYPRVIARQDRLGSPSADAFVSRFSAIGSRASKFRRGSSRSPTASSFRTSSKGDAVVLIACQNITFGILQ